MKKYLLWVVLWMGCTGAEITDVDLPELSIFGERVAIGTDGTVALCPGTVSMLDHHIKNMEQKLHLTRPGRAEIYLIGDTEKIKAICGSFMGCFNGALGISAIHPDTLDQFALTHELVHDFAASTKFGSLPLILSEGLAVLFGTDTCDRPAPTKTPVEHLLALAPDDKLMNSEYTLGALFVGWLLDNYDNNQVILLLGSLEKTSPIETIRNQFEKYLGNFDNILSAFEANRPKYLPRFDRCPNPTTSNIDFFHWSTKLSCQTPGVVDDFTDGHRHRISDYLEVRDVAQFWVETNGSSTVVLQPCDCEKNETVSLTFITAGVTDVQLSAGLYRVDLLVLPSQSQTVSYTIEIREYALERRWQVSKSPTAAKHAQQSTTRLGCGDCPG